MKKRIELTEINSVRKVLEKIKFRSIDDSSYLFLPIASIKMIEDDMFQLVNKEKINSNSGVSAGLSLRFLESDNKKDEGKTILTACLAYADSSYAYEFDIITFAKLTDTKLSKNDIEVLSSLECYLIKSSQFLEFFKF